jgi:MoaE-MoaD fusion protein
MTFEVRLFARAKDLAGAESVRVELPPGATVADLRRRLAADHPALAGLLGRCAVAVNDELADDASALPPRAGVAVLPPVRGRSAEPNRKVPDLFRP